MLTGTRTHANLEGNRNLSSRSAPAVRSLVKQPYVESSRSLAYSRGYIWFILPVYCLFPNGCDNSLMPPLGGVLLQLQTPTAGDVHHMQPEAKENRKTINKIGKKKTRQLHNRYTYIGPVQLLIGHQVPFSTVLRRCLHPPNVCPACPRRRASLLGYMIVCYGNGE